MMRYPRNVLGGPLDTCSNNPLTGFYRTGCCDTGSEDDGVHTICVILTNEFLNFSRLHGNDLSTPRPEWDFPGLQAGQQWCLCASRWQEALEAGVAPDVRLAATHELTLEFVSLEDLMAHAVDAPMQR